MSLDVFEQAAKDADEGLPAFFGRMQRLAEQGLLVTFIASFEYRESADESASDWHHRLSYFAAPNTGALAALGALDYAKDAILQSISDAPTAEDDV